jgi:hypothetical protein
MNRRLFPLWTALALLCSHAASPAEPLPDYIRYAEDDASARLEIAIRSFKLPSGQKVDLIGVVHIADESYYRGLNGRFAAYDSVLFELVGDPQRLTAKAPITDASEQELTSTGAVSYFQQAVGQYLKLTFQLDGIDYSRKNLVHADATREEFAKMQQERGETMATLFSRAMQAQSKGQVGGSMNELDTFALIRILMSPDSAAAFKKALAKMFDQIESLTAAMEGTSKSAILGGRNEVAVKKLREVLADRKQRRVAVFYGVAHMPGIETALTQDLKAMSSGEEWLAAWTMPKIKPASTAP